MALDWAPNCGWRPVAKLRRPWTGEAPKPRRSRRALDTGSVGHSLSHSTPHSDTHTTPLPTYHSDPSHTPPPTHPSHDDELRCPHRTRGGERRAETPSQTIPPSTPTIPALLIHLRYSAAPNHSRGSIPATAALRRLSFTHLLSLAASPLSQRWRPAIVHPPLPRSSTCPQSLLLPHRHTGGPGVELMTAERGLICEW